MKVKELVNQLKQYDPEREIPVFFRFNSMEFEFEIDRVVRDFGVDMCFQPIIEAHIVKTTDRKEKIQREHVIEL